MTALIRMRLAGFLRTGRPLGPGVAVLAVLGILYGGGQAAAGEAYGVSAVVLFPVLAWHTKLLLDTEPDGQRRLARVTLSSAGKEAAAGLAAALTSAVPLLLVALVLPWLIGGVRGPRTPTEPSLAAGLLAGVWAHLVVLPPALALGALASRDLGQLRARRDGAAGRRGRCHRGTDQAFVAVLARPSADLDRPSDRRGPANPDGDRDRRAGAGVDGPRGRRIRLAAPGSSVTVDIGVP